MLAVVVMINIIASRHFTRFHWSADNRIPLSPLTTQVLNSLTNDVQVTVYFDKNDPLFSSVMGLLKEYQLACPRLKVEYVDYIVSPGRAALVKARYKLSSLSDKDLVIFDTGANPPRIVYGKELSEYDWSGVLSGGKEVKRTAFRGEQFFTSAIMGVSEPKPFKAYALRGHSEHDPEEVDERSGYSRFTQLLKDKNISVSTLLLQTNDVPADCQLLIIAGPQHAFSQLELERVENYLSHGGRALILLLNTLTGARNSGLERTLGNWGVDVGDNLVMDTPQGRTERSPTVLVNDFGDHPIVKPLVGSQLIFNLPRSVRRVPTPSQTSDTIKVAELAFTSPSGVAVRNIRNQQGIQEAKGSIPLMVAVEKGAIQGVKTDRGATRIVVAGDSSFLANNSIDTLANHEMANLSVNWLLDRGLLLQIGPQPVREFKVFVSEADMNSARWILLAAMPGFALALGLLVWLRRRK
jgi:ABC-type uncharacterized transport system involved in gliding motility auxiliary subunit